MIGQFASNYTDPRLAELDAIIASLPSDHPAKRPGPKPGQRCDGSAKRARLDRVAAAMRARGGKSYLNSEACSWHARRAAEARWKRKSIAWLCHGQVFRTRALARKAHGRPKRIEMGGGEAA